MATINLPRFLTIRTITAVVVVFAVTGGLLLLLTRAATGTVSLEAEDATPIGAASAGAVAGASGGDALTVNISPATPPPPAPTPPPPASEPVVRAINFHPEPDNSRLEKAFEKIVEGRIQAVRLNFHWDDFQPNAKGQWATGRKAWMDRFEELAHQHNVKILAIPMKSPGWANGGQPADSRNFKDADFCDYIKDIEAEWGRSIEAYEIWNEPSLTGFMQGTIPEKAARYASVLKSSYACIKAFDPNRPVLGVSIYQPVHDNVEFLDLLYGQHGIKGHYDIFSQHAYGDNGKHADGYNDWYARNMPPSPNYTGPMTYKQLFDEISKRTLETLKKYGDGDKPIWFTETGVSTTAGGNSEAKQAELLGEAYDLVKQGYVPNIKRVYWYQLEDVEALDPNNYEHRLGIISWTGNGHRTKPAFEMLKSK